MKKRTFQTGILTIAVCLLLSISLIGCGKAEPADTAQSDIQANADESGIITELVGTPSDYSDKENWMTVPEITHAVDTFYLYPTCYLDDSEEALPICNIDNQAVRERAQVVYENQATVFEESTNVFAPYYRQSNIYEVMGMDSRELEAFQKKEQRTDVYAALDYYFEHYNNGRPFIIAGHSQGSIMTKIVLGEYMAAHPEYYERMVAAYVIGYSITSDWLKEHPYLKFAEGAGDTGVIVSWNTRDPEIRRNRISLWRTVRSASIRSTGSGTALMPLPMKTLEAECLTMIPAFMRSRRISRMPNWIPRAAWLSVRRTKQPILTLWSFLDPRVFTITTMRSIMKILGRI